MQHHRRDTLKHTSEYMITMNGGVASYHSGPQTITALRTAMAETKALVKLVAKIKYRVLWFDL